MMLLLGVAVGCSQAVAAFRHSNFSVATTPNPLLGECHKIMMSTDEVMSVPCILSNSVSREPERARERCYATRSIGGWRSCRECLQGTGAPCSQRRAKIW